MNQLAQMQGKRVEWEAKRRRIVGLGCVFVDVCHCLYRTLYIYSIHVGQTQLLCRVLGRDLLTAFPQERIPEQTT